MPARSRSSSPDTASPDPASTAAPLPSSVRAAAYHRYGRPEDVVAVERIAPPELRDPHDVLVHVDACVVGAGDWRIGVADPDAGLLRAVRLSRGAIATSSPTADWASHQPCPRWRSTGWR